MALLDNMGISDGLREGIDDLFSKDTISDVIKSGLHAGEDALRDKARAALARSKEGQSAGRGIVVDQFMLLLQSPWLWGSLALLAVVYVIGKRA